MSVNLSTYQELYRQAKSSLDFQYSGAQAFVAKLLALPPQDRFALLPLFKQISEDAFTEGIEIPNLDYQSLEKAKEEWDSNQNKPIESKARLVKAVSVQVSFDDVLLHFFAKYNIALSRVKGYYLFSVQNISDESKTHVRILYDDDFNTHPEINSFDEEESKYDLKKFSIEDFSNIASVGADIRNQNYLLVFLITPHLRDNRKLIESITSILNLFTDRFYVAIKEKPVTHIRHYHQERFQNGIDAIRSYTSKVFNNRELSFDEESILKSLFSGDQMILDYKILKGGNSGSKVIEVQPSKADTSPINRFVAKISPITDERKLKIEKERFKQSISYLSVPNYFADYNETNTHEGIMYNYASSDSKRDSYSFAKLIDDTVNEKYDYLFSIADVINELFTCDPYKKWQENVIASTVTVRELYADYLKSEQKVFKKIALIEGISLEKLPESDFIKEYTFIKNHSFKTNKKTCHGDLHSENFFKDDKGVYLIDFGWTDKHHALIDHTTLECSLKFKHIPFYVSSDEFMRYENLLVSSDSFSPNFDVSTINRKTISDIYSLILQIRLKAKDLFHDKGSQLEYLISLYIITFRQIQYPDLNQKFALESARMLSKKIVNMIQTA